MMTTTMYWETFEAVFVDLLATLKFELRKKRIVPLLSMKTRWSSSKINSRKGPTYTLLGLVVSVMSSVKYRLHNVTVVDTVCKVLIQW